MDKKNLMNKIDTNLIILSTASALRVDKEEILKDKGDLSLISMIIPHALSEKISDLCDKAFHGVSEEGREQLLRVFGLFFMVGIESCGYKAAEDLERLMKILERKEVKQNEG